jgi:hypothetical protein
MAPKTGPTGRREGWGWYPVRMVNTRGRAFDKNEGDNANPGADTWREN